MAMCIVHTTHTNKFLRLNYVIYVLSNYFNGMLFPLRSTVYFDGKKTFQCCILCLASFSTLFIRWCCCCVLCWLYSGKSSSAYNHIDCMWHNFTRRKWNTTKMSQKEMHLLFFFPPSNFSSLEMMLGLIIFCFVLQSTELIKHWDRDTTEAIKELMDFIIFHQLFDILYFKHFFLFDF